MITLGKMIWHLNKFSVEEMYIIQISLQNL